MRLLERGGDDMLVKPFSYPELRARIAACSGAPSPAGRSHSCPPARCVSIYTTAACPSTSVRWSFSGRYPLRCQPPGEPTRVLTKVNFETRSEEGQGARDSRARGGIW